MLQLLIDAQEAAGRYAAAVAYLDDGPLCDEATVCPTCQGEYLKAWAIITDDVPGLLEHARRLCRAGLCDMATGPLAALVLVAHDHGCEGGQDREAHA